jgi:hypothetical protein
MAGLLKGGLVAAALVAPPGALVHAGRTVAAVP